MNLSSLESTCTTISSSSERRLLMNRCLFDSNGSSVRRIRLHSSPPVLRFGNHYRQMHLNASFEVPTTRSQVIVDGSVTDQQPTASLFRKWENTRTAAFEQFSYHEICGCNSFL
ncbi:unnamed protein product [Linum trigynum]|uniref:Uncharacterized protein n=1 Tax=Linum trigynum TaxID=586398 RepID=A0AAV2DX55_9ROSI